jgi:predicted DNA-binding antitoxin AbrB/MazE fold protein
MSQEGIERDSKNLNIDATSLPALPTLPGVATENNVTSHLTLAPPVESQSNIEFNEVFKVTAGKSFNVLYRSISQSNTDKTDNALSKLTNDNYSKQITVIDRRPLRWYEQLRNFNRDITELEKRRKTAIDDLKAINDVITGFKPTERVGAKKTDYIAERRQYNETWQKIKNLDALLSSLQSAKRRTSYEISAAGYILTEKDGVTTIWKPVPPADATSPLDLTTIKTLTNELWLEVSTKLENALFKDNNKLITNPGKVKDFYQTKAELVDTQSNPAIKNQLTKLQTDIDTLNKQIADVHADGDAVVAKLNDNCKKLIAGWQAEYDKRNNIYQTAKNSIKQKYPNLAENSAEFLWLMRIAVYSLGWTTTTLEVLVQQMDSYLTSIQKANKECDDAVKANEASIKTKVDQYNAQLTLAQADLTNLKSNMDNLLLEQRVNFLLHWNNPENYDTQRTLVAIPDSDPLQVFYNDLNQKNAGKLPTKVHNFTFQGDGYYDQESRKLEEFMKMANLGSKMIILPCIDQNGQISTELLRIIQGPRRPGPKHKLEMPDMKIVETQDLSVAWQRYALSSLGNTVNLAPGEKKQIVVKTQTSITRAVTQSKTSSSEVQSNITSSFESNLTNELSTTYNKSYSDNNASAYKQDASNSNKSLSQTDKSSGDSTSASAKANASFLDGAFSASGEASTSSTNSKKSSQAQSMEAAIAVSQSKNVQTLSSTSRAVSAKNTANRVRKVATETSTNNKVEVSSTMSESVATNTDNKEIKTLHNPNEGCTINYNLFQLQNVYELKTTLKDVKIVVNTGREIVEGSGLFELKTYELEDFGKIFKSTAKSDADVLLCALIARKIIKSYTDIMADPAANEGILRLKVKSDQNTQLLMSQLALITKKLNLSHLLKKDKPQNGEDPNTVLKNKLIELRAQLELLQGFNFELQDKHLIHNSKYIVNSPGYHMDSQRGYMPATENYLEERRKLTLQEHANINDLIAAEAEKLRGAGNKSPAMKTTSEALQTFTFLPAPRPIPVAPPKRDEDTAILAVKSNP